MPSRRIAPYFDTMAAHDNTYSRVVSWLKVILPLLALAGLSTLFLVARTIDPAQTIPYSDVDIDELANEQRIGGPTFSGMTASGAAYRLSAARAWPSADGAGTMTGEEISASIDLTDGTRVSIRAGAASYANAARLAGLTDGVTVDIADGYRMTTPSLSLTLDQLRLWSDQAVTITGPGLRLDAGQFDLTGRGTEAEPYVLVFKDNVKLLYDFER